jgi:hypothetical protein
MDRATQTQVVEMRGSRVQTHFDVAQTFTPSQLRESQTNELVPTRELADFVVTAITSDAALELLRMNPVQKLRQNVFSTVHPERIGNPRARDAQIDHTPLTQSSDLKTRNETHFS